MIRTRSLCPHEACLIAVSALDDLVAKLVKACHLQLPPVFFDWVADEATPLVEQQMDAYFDHPQFAASLRSGDPRLALAGWVHQWVRPGVATRFAELLPHLPAADSHLPTLPVLVPAPAAPMVVPAAVSAPRPRPRTVPGRVVPA